MITAATARDRQQEQDKQPRPRMPPREWAVLYAHRSLPDGCPVAFALDFVTAHRSVFSGQDIPSNAWMGAMPAQD